MSYSIITADKFNTINWSGGTSTQLYIYPETSDYAQRNFEFRLSTAKVEVKESDFTHLPGISRKIMILDGEIEIRHKNRYTKKLKRFAIDEFEGDWYTSSVGVCTDFNLMTQGETKGLLSSLHLAKNETSSFEISNTYSKIIIYLYSGQIEFEINGEKIRLNQGELLLIDTKLEQNIRLNSLAPSDLIISKIEN